MNDLKGLMNKPKEVQTDFAKAEQSIMESQRTGRVSSGISTAQAGGTYKSDSDYSAVHPTIIQMDMRTYKAEKEAYDREYAKILHAEQEFRSLNNKQAYDLERKDEAIKTLGLQLVKMTIALLNAGIKLIPLRNQKGFRVVILKRKPKKK